MLPLDPQYLTPDLTSCRCDLTRRWCELWRRAATPRAAPTGKLREARLLTADEVTAQMRDLRRLLPVECRLVFLGVPRIFAEHGAGTAAAAASPAASRAASPAASPAALPHSHAWRAALAAMPPALRRDLDARLAAVHTAAAAAAAALPNAAYVDRCAHLHEEGDLHEWLHLSRRATHEVADAVAREVLRERRGESEVGGGAGGALDADGDLDLRRPRKRARPPA